MIKINYKTELLINNNLKLNINFYLEEIKLDEENLKIMYLTKAVVVIKKKNCISWSFIIYTSKIFSLMYLWIIMIVCLRSLR